MDRIFKKLSKDSQVKKVLSKLKNENKVNEEVFGMDGDSSADMTAFGGTFFGYPSAQLFLQSAGGKLLLAKVAAALGMPSLAYLGVGAIGFLAPIAIGFIIDAIANKVNKGYET